MSTKIYSGYKIEAKDWMQVLLNYAAGVQSTIEKENAYANKLVEYRILAHAIFERKNLASKLWKEHKQGFEESIKYEILVKPKKNGCLAVFTGHPLLEKRFAETPGIKYWGYWDNTDPPEDILPQEWEQRRREWDFLEYGVPAVRQMLVFSPFTSYDYRTFRTSWVNSVDARFHAVYLFVLSRKPACVSLQEASRIARRLQWRVPLMFGVLPEANGLYAGRALEKALRHVNQSSLFSE